MTLRLGSLCTGYGGLDMAVAQVLDVTPAWVADPDPGAAAILAHHWPDVPNLSDITRVDFAQVEPIDVLTAGFPCQDISYAGRGAGIREGTRSGLWHVIADAVRVLRPRLLVLENVRAIVSRRPGLDVVLGDLARFGFDAVWTCVRASDIGAPHKRERWFLVAHPNGERDDRPAAEHRPARRPLAPGDPVADAYSGGSRSDKRDLRPRQPHPARRAAADPARDGRPEPTRLVRRPDAALGRHAPAHPTSIGHGDAWTPGLERVASAAVSSAAADSTGLSSPDESRDDRPGLVLAEPGTGRGDLSGRNAPRTGGDRDPSGVVAWGPYGPAIHRWARVLGRPAPPPRLPTGRNGTDQLNPVFVEWLMGLPRGWVTVIPGLTRNQMLKALGNGVVPQQGAAALTELLCRIGPVATNDTETAA